MSAEVLATTSFAKPGRVLVVDDDDAFLQVVSEMLKGDLHSVCRAADGEAALKAVRDDKPDLVLLDVRLPGMDGLEVCRRLKTDPGLRSIPVILMTAFTDAEIHVRGLECGANDFLAKPVDPAILRARVRALLKYRRAVQTLRKTNRDLARANERLRTLQRKRDEMNRVIVHDLKNPLAVVQGHVRLALMFAKSSPSPDLQRSLALSDQACNKLLKMVFNLHDLRRLEKDAPALSLVQTEADALAEKAVQPLRPYAEFCQKRIVLETQANLPPLRVEATLLLRALEVLLLRALDDGPAQGQVTLGTESQPDGAGIRFWVSYAGPAARFVEKAEPGGADGADGVGTPVKGDRGMALTFCKLVGEKHGGTFSIEADPGNTRHCRFVLTLPANPH